MFCSEARPIRRVQSRLLAVLSCMSQMSSVSKSQISGSSTATQSRQTRDTVAVMCKLLSENDPTPGVKVSSDVVSDRRS